MRNRIISVAVAVLICMLPLSGCYRRVGDTPLQEPQKNDVLTSFYPIYALTQGIVDGIENINLRCLVQPQDGCLRNYALSEWDAHIISGAGIMILGGRGLESFESYLENLGADGPAVITAMSGLTLRGEDQPVSQDEEEVNHFEGPNPWLFLSAQGAGNICEVIAESMIYIDPDNERKYLDNLEQTQSRLDDLLREMRDTVRSVTPAPVALMHEGLGYLSDELGLDAKIVIPREPGQDYELDALEEVISEIKSADVHTVLLEMQAPTRLKRELRKAGLTIAEIDTLQTHMPDGRSEGYFEAMRKNARAVADAFRGLS